MIKWQDHVLSDPDVLVGKPTIKGTRLAVEFIIELFASGWSVEDVLENYPRLTKDDITAIFAFISEGIKDGLIGYVPPKIA